MTRPGHEFELVRFYIDWGLNNCEIERLTGISRSTILGWRDRVRLGITNSHLQGRSACPLCDRAPIDEARYAYLLGLYLGDGYIVEIHRGVYRFQVTQDQRYSGLMGACDDAMSNVVPGARINVGFQQQVGCINVYSYWKHWPCLFPQHGSGVKHTRRIALVPWQERIADKYADLLLRGLIHSDGYRGMNRIKRPVHGELKEYRYPRYQFTNESADIREIFCVACDRLAINWRQMNRKTISIARKHDVEKLDAIVGPKC